MAKRGLGRGLSSLIPTVPITEELKVEQIPLTDIMPNPNQPRKHFDPEAFKELVASIKEYGLVQPIVVRSRGAGYELVAGERRWRAAKEANLTTIPSIIKRSTDTESLEIGLIENLQREDLNAIEEASAYRQLVEGFDITQAELASRLGKSRTAITNTLRLLQLSEGIKHLIADGNISSGHARALLALEDEEHQKKLAERIMEEGLSVRQAENIVRLWQLSRSAKRSHRRHLEPNRFKQVARKMAKALSARVRIKMYQKKGKIEIDFKSVEDLERIFKLLTELASRRRPVSPSSK